MNNNFDKISLENSKFDQRYETKFNITNLNNSQIVNIIKTNPAIFHNVHNKRFINNIYFDDINLTNYRDNIEGEKNRKKVRIRWYGNIFGLCKKPVLEIKFKTGLLGWKERYNLKEFSLNKLEYFNCKNIFRDLNKIRNSNILNLFTKFLTPTLLNSYERTYYMSFDKKFRVTVDKKMKFYSINPTKNYFKTFLDDEQTILELKYKHIHYNIAEKITSHFPFRVTKNSKYVVGIDRLRNW
ncbi:polyphosphate polymerase domain-containing protein [Alphaproteobacteria bacterium]|nr:polyphosphate polymerase domain-containing protein [Alphaproteobacteria bacterium]